MEQSTPVCDCPEGHGRVALRTSKKENENKGKMFYTCDNSCGFFLWKECADVQCHCPKGHGRVSKNKVQKDSPNKGQYFFSCIKCNFFEWCDKEYIPPGACYNCGLYGHFQEDCDMEDD